MGNLISPVKQLFVDAVTLGGDTDAREGYLRALAMDPKMVDARYNLAVLTQGVGADDEVTLNALKQRHAASSAR